MGRTETIGVRKGVQVRRTKGLRLGLGKLGDSVQRSGARDDGRDTTKRHAFRNRKFRFLNSQNRFLIPVRNRFKTETDPFLKAWSQNRFETELMLVSKIETAF